MLIHIYWFIIKLFSLFNDKAKLWVNGRKNQLIPDLKHEKVIWMHCSSLGEFEQGRPVFEKLKERNPNYKFVLSFFSPSGYESLKNKKIADFLLYLPIDTPGSAKRYIDKINPEISIFVKYDFWYNYLRILNNRNYKVIYISVLLGNNHRLFKSYNRFILDELKEITKIFTQDHLSFSELINHGFINVEQAGDTRIDRVIEIAESSFEDKIIKNFIYKEKKVFICGSTWEKDIDILSGNKDLLLSKYKLIIAPHEISEKQIKYIAQKFDGNKIVRYSSNGIKFNDNFEILIVDKIGILSRIYRYADVAYIGGGFGKSIHNTLEPASYIIPVIFGPNYKKFTEANFLVSKNAFFSINDVKEFKEIILSLDNIEIYNQTQRTIRKFLENNKNASFQIIEYIEKQMNRR